MIRDDVKAESPLVKNLKIAIAAILIAVGPLSLIASHLPLGILVPFTILGFVAGALSSFRDSVLQAVAMLLVVMGLSWLEHRAGAAFTYGGFPTWQPTAVTFSAWMLTHVAIRRALKLPVSSD
jgi:hypothetical protein